jgi:NADPH2:quinone reductase
VKAAVYYETGPPDVFRYEDVPDAVCGPGSVLIEVEAVSIEGGDVGNRAGGELAGKPHVVGYQAAGVIREVGANVTDRTPGQRVVGVSFFGSHAELFSVPAQSTWVIPDGLDTKLAACVPIAYGTAHVCLHEFGRLSAGETVLIQGGAGGVGLAAIQIAKRAGATTIATASSDEKLERLKSEFGLDHGVNYSTGDMVDDVKKASGGGGVNLVVDSVGTTLQGSIQCLTYKGRVVTVGDAGRGRKAFDPAVLMAQNLTLTGVFLGAELFMGDGVQVIAQLIDDVARGDLKVVIDREFALSDAAAAHAHIESRQAFGRVLLVP